MTEYRTLFPAIFAIVLPLSHCAKVSPSTDDQSLASVIVDPDAVQIAQRLSGVFDNAEQVAHDSRYKNSSFEMCTVAIDRRQAIGMGSTAYLLYYQQTFETGEKRVGYLRLEPKKRRVHGISHLTTVDGIFHPMTHIPEDFISPCERPEIPVLASTIPAADPCPVAFFRHTDNTYRGTSFNPKLSRAPRCDALENAEGTRSHHLSVSPNSFKEMLKSFDKNGLPTGPLAALEYAIYEKKP